MAPLGNTEERVEDKADSPTTKCQICGSLMCKVDEHTNDVYCLCEDSKVAIGNPPTCNHPVNFNVDIPNSGKFNGKNHGLRLPSDIFKNNPAFNTNLETNSQTMGEFTDQNLQEKVVDDDSPEIPSHSGIDRDSLPFRLDLNTHCPTEEVCKNVNCGEAGCTCNPKNNQSFCLCPESKMQPDKDLKCHYKVQDPIDDTVHLNAGPPIDILGVLPPKSIGSQPKPPSNYTDSTTPFTVPSQSQNHPFSSHHIQMLLQISIPAFLGVLLVAILIMVMLWRRKVRLHNRKPKAGNVVSWIQKQDQVHLLENMTVVGKNPIYLGYNANSMQLKGIQTTYIPQGSLKLMDVIGEGAFGKVYKGTVKWTDDNTSSVAVKILKEDASTETRNDFVREVKIMSSFNHPNILKLIGVVTAENQCPYMVFEYMEYGDLTDLLRGNDPYCKKGQKLEVKQHELVDIATQIANGMVYLASKHFVHRDLATRNCLVGAELVVKISDFGMSRDIYTCDYYKIGGSRMLPVRWMSSESIKYGRFTTESDVWSYGVVLWEIFAFGKQPYYGHTNEEVIRLIDDGILLQRPSNCPDTVYHVMLGCWRKNPKDRFNFERIHRHLKDYNKTMAICYQPSPMTSSTDMASVQNI